MEEQFAMDNKQELVSTFLEITTSNCRDYATNILKEAGWNIQAAVELFFECGGSLGESTISPSNPHFNLSFADITPTGWGSEDEDDIDNGLAHHYFDAIVNPSPLEDENEVEEGEEHLHFNSAIPASDWGSEDENETAEFQEHDDNENKGWNSEDENEVAEFQEHDDNENIDCRLESNVGTYEDSDWREEEEFHETNFPAICLVFYGDFYEAKVQASTRDKWLLVHVQQREQFNSHLLKREPWSTVTVQEQLSSHFVFWETYHEDIEGQKVCCFYKVTTFPTIMVIDPITGAKMHVCHEMKQPENILKDLMSLYDKSPKQQLAESIRRKDDNVSSGQIVENEVTQPKETSLAVITKPSYPPLPEEPTDEKLICRVGICLPSSQRVRRNFLKTDPTKLLWSFCSTLLDEEESQSFHFIVPNSPNLFYDNDATFEEAALSNTLLRLSVEIVN